MSRFAVPLVLALVAACTTPPSATTNPPATSAPPAVTASAAASPSPSPGAAACPPIRQISLGTVTGRATYPQGIQNAPPYPVMLVKVDDPSVYRSVHFMAGVGDPFVPRSFTVQAVEPGTYVAVGYLSADHFAAYTPAVACGLGPTCTDHTLTRVTVRAGETTSGIDVLDWSVPRAAWPARPSGSQELEAGAAARVCNPYADSANMRASAGLGFPVRRTLDNGAAIVVRGGPLAADGYDWYEVNLAGDQLASGWVVAYALAR